ncbi:MAG: molybdopterin/thiamine biosynthesis adenylyltransferase [Candidatus Azotimanducaceae bacterium]|jgi:molybdopterin/thiamine biosynthesis adenylyltransferase|tara:strand:- start:66 stop:818 length:753 start_codon:yes stop_codon:yes gene_type:complete
MNDQQLLRFSRQIMLPDFDIDGQQRLLRAKVLLIGLGGLGSPIAMYLAAAGVGELILIDDDHVDLSNLQRQIAHREQDVGINKAESAAAAIHDLNSETKVTVISRRLEGAELAGQISEADLVIDATDNFDSRHSINALCWKTKTPLVSGAAIRWEGQISVFDPMDPQSPCYQCLYPETDTNGLEMNCAENGVIAPLVGIIGCCQALEAIKYLAGSGSSLVGYSLFFDGKYMEWRKLKLSKAQGCPICSES